MMQNILLFGLGLVVGVVFSIFLIALLSANKRDDIEHEKLVSFKEGYQKGFDDGCELHKSHLK